MNFNIEPMDRNFAIEVTNWTYKPPYDFYNMDNGKEAIDELLNGTYFKILNENEVLVGFCCFGNSAKVPIGIQYGAYPENGTIDVGLGMRPELTGHGSGYTFVSSILEFAKAQFATQSFRLTVAKFNERAIEVYKKLGFTPVVVFPMADVEFLTMEKINV